MIKLLSISGFIFHLLITMPVIASDEQKQDNATPITVTRSISRPLDITIPVPGTLESASTPIIAAEIDGRIIQLNTVEGQLVSAGDTLAKIDDEAHLIALEKAEADVKRIEILIKNHRRTVKRFKGLVKRQSSAQSSLDKAETDLAAALAELIATKARAKDTRYKLSKTIVVSPISGKIQFRQVSVGDYVKTGNPMFQVVATDQLIARLSIAGTLTGHIKIGQAVKLKIGAQPIIVEGQISRLPPMLNPSNSALEALVDFANPGDWQPGNGVLGIITLETRSKAILVPVLSLVRRPVGTIVYRIKNNRAIQQVVKTGKRDGDLIEITSGLNVNETIALDGAGFLTDGVAVDVRDKK